MADNTRTSVDEQLKLSLSKNLDDIFGISDGPIELTKSVEDKRRTVHTRSKELQELEQRIREAEERLRSVGQPYGDYEANTSSEGGSSENGNGQAEAGVSEKGLLSQPPSRPPPKAPGQS